MRFVPVRHLDHLNSPVPAHRQHHRADPPAFWHARPWV